MIRKGTYVLFLRFDHKVEAEVGSLGRIVLEAGTYCYVGSAMNGLDQRVSRHLSHEKKKRWHIDFLTMMCSDMTAYEHEGDSITECGLADLLQCNGGIPAMKGFGCSDCGCQTHLFRVDGERTRRALEGLGMTVFADRRVQGQH